jgi:hypothetical protein
MAQTGFTPIQLYYSTTAATAPSASNIANGELAINITDGKLFYKDNAAAVQVIGWKVVPATAGGTGQTSYAIGDILYASTSTALSKLADVATGNALISGGVGVAPSYGKIGLTTHVSGILPVANGGTNASSASITAFNNITGYTAAGATGTTSTNLVFSTSPSITTPTLVGDATLSTGNLIQGTAAKGFNFTANTPAAGMTSQLLNWYEEGTFTPTLIGTTTNPTVTYGIQRGAYTKIGRLVTVSVYMTWSAFSGGSGNVGFGNFPFTIESTIGSNFAGSIALFDGFTLSSLRTSVGLLGAAGTKYSQPTCFGSAVSSQYIAVGSVAATGLVLFTLTYSV